MRSETFQRGVVLFALLPSLQGEQTRIGEAGGQQSSDSSGVAQRIERVENGLLPATVLQGETPPRMKLEDRMKFYRTPGISVAVINGGKI